MRLRRRTVLLTCCAIALGGCKPKALPGTADLSVARSTSTDLAPEAKTYSGRVVTYSRGRGLLADGVVIASPVPSGATELARSANNPGPDVLIPPLRKALEDAKADRVIIALDAATPYAVVVQITFTLMQSKIFRFEYLARNSERYVLVPVEALPVDDFCGRAAMMEAMQAEMPRALSEHIDVGAPVPLKEREAACLHVAIEADGVIVKAGKDVLASSCVDFGTGYTIPRRAGSIDGSALARCLHVATSMANGAATEPRRPAGAESLKARDARVIVSARRDTPWQDVVVALDAVRESGSAPALGLAR